MSVHTFKRPELDEQIRTALVELGEAEGAYRFFVGEQRILQDVYDAVKTGVPPAAAAMLADELNNLKEQAETARQCIGHWNAILDVLKKRTA